MIKCKKRTIICLVLTAALSMGLLGSSVTAKEKLVIWSNFTELENGKNRPIQWVYNEFEKKYNVEIESIYFKYEELQKKLMMAFAADKAPDMFIAEINWMSIFLKDGLIEPFPADIQEKWLSEILPVYTDFEVEGKVWCTPYSSNFYGLTYNRDMFKEAGLNPERGPDTWSEFRDYAKKLTKYDAEEEIERVGFALRHVGAPAGVIDKAIWLLWGAGASLVEPRDILKGGKAGFNNESGRSAVKLIYDMLYTDRSTSLEFPDPRAAFVRGLAAMQVSELAAIGMQAPIEAPDMDWGISVPPAPAGKEKVTLAAGEVWYVTSASSQKDLGFKFIDFLLEPEIDLWAAINVRFPGYGNAPYLKVNQKFPYFDNPYNRGRNAIVPYGRYFPHNLALLEVTQIVGRWMAKAWHEEVTIEQAFDQAEKEVNAALIR